MKTFTEMEIEEVKKLCTSAVELCERLGVVHKLGTKSSGPYTLDGIEVDIPIENLESIRCANTRPVDSALLGVLNRLVDFTDCVDCKGKKKQKRKANEDFNRQHINDVIDEVNKDTAEVAKLKKEIKKRLRGMNLTPLKLLANKDLILDLWLELRAFHGMSIELFEKNLIDVLHEEYGYSIESLKP